MISGANEEELELANARTNILLNCYSSDLETVDKYYKQEIDRLNNIINELEKWLEENIKQKPLLTTYFFKCDGKERSISEIELEKLKKVLDKLKELKENNNGK